ncbi:MAG: S4 domain-containing protein YaaA [Mycoplasmataceae bacterium]|jgi:S4 domain protein YaaA|nr:S4 domain-containing protein YaaA [Mycoplasmataceae bacterium]
MKAQEVIINNDFITLGQFLKFAKIVVSGGQIRSFLLSNHVLVNQANEQRRGKKLYNNDVVDVSNKQFVIKTKGN